MSHSDLAAERGEPSYVWRSGQVRRLALIARWTKPGGRLLDNGCGLGAYAQALAPICGQRFGLEVEPKRAAVARDRCTGVVVGRGERLPFADDSFDLILSNEVIEHVADDRLALAEMVRAARPGGRIALFCPNRWYPVEQHGIYWRGRYHFGNIPFVNYLPRSLRGRLAPHVRAYSAADLRQLLAGLPLKTIHHSRIFGGYDNIAGRWPRLGRWLRRALYWAEGTPLALFGLSHFLVLEKAG
ncbi:MAG: class I SAM-dependent methyltransferase [Candidatus Promineifilaceae bacterium]